MRGIPACVHDLLKHRAQLDLETTPHQSIWPKTTEPHSFQDLLECYMSRSYVGRAALVTHTQHSEHCSYHLLLRAQGQRQPELPALTGGLKIVCQ